MTQHFETFNNIPFTKGGFSWVQNARKLFSFSAGALPRTPLGDYDAPPDLLVDWDVMPSPHAPSPSAHSASQCPVRFVNTIT